MVWWNIWINNEGMILFTFAHSLIHFPNTQEHKHSYRETNKYIHTHPSLLINKCFMLVRVWVYSYCSAWLCKRRHLNLNSLFIYTHIDMMFNFDCNWREYYIILFVYFDCVLWKRRSTVNALKCTPASQQQRKTLTSLSSWRSAFIRFVFI